MLGLLCLAFWRESNVELPEKRVKMLELVNPEISGEERGQSMKLENIGEVMQFVNLNLLGGAEIYEVELYRSKQDETRDFDLFAACPGVDESIEALASQTY